MEFKPTLIPDVILIKPKVYGDERGYFLESWQQKKFADAGIAESFVQDNQSRSAQYTLRGLHYQIKQAQGKLVRVTRGVVFDVAVDLRRSSPSFGQWVGAELSEANHQMLWVPPGFAHGFLALSEVVDFQYKCTDFYAPQYERSLRWNDPKLCIEWPLPPGAAPLLATRDAQAPGLDAAECFS